MYCTPGRDLASIGLYELEYLLGFPGHLLDILGYLILEFGRWSRTLICILGIHGLLWVSYNIFGYKNFISIFCLSGKLMPLLWFLRHLWVFKVSCRFLDIISISTKLYTYFTIQFIDFEIFWDKFFCFPLYLS